MKKIASIVIGTVVIGLAYLCLCLVMDRLITWDGQVQSNIYSQARSNMQGRVR